MELTSCFIKQWLTSSSTCFGFCAASTVAVTWTGDSWDWQPCMWHFWSTRTSLWSCSRRRWRTEHWCTKQTQLLLSCSSARLRYHAFVEDMKKDLQGHEITLEHARQSTKCYQLLLWLSVPSSGSWVYANLASLDNVQLLPCSFWIKLISSIMVADCLGMMASAGKTWFSVV